MIFISRCLNYKPHSLHIKWYPTCLMLQIELDNIVDNGAVDVQFLV